MIIVWNSENGATYGFANIKAYKNFAIKTEQKGRTCWADTVFDVGLGGEASTDNEMDLYSLKCEINKIACNP